MEGAPAGSQDYRRTTPVRLFDLELNRRKQACMPDTAHGTPVAPVCWQRGTPAMADCNGDSKAVSWLERLVQPQTCLDTRAWRRTHDHSDDRARGLSPRLP